MTFGEPIFLLSLSFVYFCHLFIKTIVNVNFNAKSNVFRNATSKIFEKGWTENQLLCTGRPSKRSSQRHLITYTLAAFRMLIRTSFGSPILVCASLFLLCTIWRSEQSSLFPSGSTENATTRRLSVIRGESELANMSETLTKSKIFWGFFLQSKVKILAIFENEKRHNKTSSFCSNYPGSC